MYINCGWLVRQTDRWMDESLCMKYRYKGSKIEDKYTLIT